MIRFTLASAAAALIVSTNALVCAAEPPKAGAGTYAEDFSKVEPGKLPEDFLVMAGDFAVKEEGGEKFLELPGSPLETFGVLFGPSQKEGVAVQARFFSTKQGRKFPAFAVSVNGVGGFRLQMSAAKKALEIFRGDAPVVSVPHEWTSGEWTTLRLQIRKTGEGWTVEGKAWPTKGEEPKEWMITHVEKDEPPGGRPGIWGAPYSGQPIRFDDLKVEPAKEK